MLEYLQGTLAHCNNKYCPQPSDLNLVGPSCINVAPSAMCLVQNTHSELAPTWTQRWHVTPRLHTEVKERNAQVGTLHSAATTVNLQALLVDRAVVINLWA